MLLPARVLALPVQHDLAGGVLHDQGRLVGVGAGEVVGAGGGAAAGGFGLPREGLGGVVPLAAIVDGEAAGVEVPRAVLAPLRVVAHDRYVVGVLRESSAALDEEVAAEGPAGADRAGGRCFLRRPRGGFRRDRQVPPAGEVLQGLQLRAVGGGGVGL